MGLKRIIVPVHGNGCDQRAIEVASSIAGTDDLELMLVYVVEVAQALPLEADLPAAVDAAERSLASAEELAHRKDSKRTINVVSELLQARTAGTAIVNEAVERNADLIVMALRNHRKHGRPTAGDTVPYVLKNAPCEVMVTRLPPITHFERCSWQPDASLAS